VVLRILERTTPGFCAPEAQDGTPDGRADVFSLGAVLYTLIAGYGWTWDAEMPATIEADAEIDAELRTILLTAVERDAVGRYQSIEKMSAVLVAYLGSNGRGALVGMTIASPALRPGRAFAEY
jgi:serine/threonine protein kinase